MAESSATASDANERTRLIDSTNATSSSYSTRGQSEGDRSESVVNFTLDNEPTVPLDELTDHIQHLLLFRQSQDTSSPPNTNSDQDQDTHEHRVTIPHQKHKKRDIFVDALHFATDQWKENQGNAKQDIHESKAVGSPSNDKIPIAQQQQQQQKQQLLLPLSPSEPQYDSIVDVWDLARCASVCAILGLIGERRQREPSTTANVDIDDNLQRLALFTLKYGLQHTMATDIWRQEMLFKPWIGNRSAIQWATDNDCYIFLGDKHVQNAIQQYWLYGDTEWKANPHHPCQVWINTSLQGTTTTNSGEGWQALFTKESLTRYLARWASPRYQCLITLLTGVIYLGVHLTTLSNVEYMADHLQDVEYFYYFLVISDLILEIYKIIGSPWMALRQPSTYLSLSTVILLFAAFIVRIIAFFTIDLQPKYQELYLSFVVLSIATPLMFFRLFIWTDALWWPIYKINYIVGQCLIQSLWVFFIALVSLIGFWVGLSALQRDDIGPWLMLRFLVLGTLHTPKIGETLSYQPQAASILLVVYLFVTVILIGALLVASFLSTILSLTKPASSFGKLQKYMEAKRCSQPTSFRVFIPNVMVELTIGSVVWVGKKAYPSTKLAGLERLRQAIWFAIFSPIILAIGLVDLAYHLFYPQQ